MNKLLDKYESYKQQIREEDKNKSKGHKLFDNILIGIIIIFLSMHLFTIHSKLLFHINPDKLINTLTYTFNIELFNQELIVSTLGAIAYSLITALILTIFVKHKTVFIITVSSFGLLDGVGVLLYYNNTNTAWKIFLMYGAIYYAIYTTAIIISVGLFRHLEYSEENYIGFDPALSKGIDNSISGLNLKETIQEIFNENNENIQDKNNIIPVNKNENAEQVLIEKVLYLSEVKKMTQIDIGGIVGKSQPEISKIIKRNKDAHN